MPALLLFLQKWWKPLGIALVFLAAYLYVNHLKGTIEDQQKTITNLTLENTIVKENNTKLEASIEANNKAISKLAEGADATQKAFATLNTNVKGQLSGLDTRLKNILADKKPVTCEETIQYLIDASKEMKK